MAGISNLDTQARTLRHLWLGLTRDRGFFAHVLAKVLTHHPMLMISGSHISIANPIIHYF